MRGNGRNGRGGLKGWGWDSSRPFGVIPDARTSFELVSRASPPTTPKRTAIPVNGGAPAYRTPRMPVSPVPPPARATTAPPGAEGFIPPNGSSEGAEAPPGTEYAPPEGGYIPTGEGGAPEAGGGTGWAQESGMYGPAVTGEEAVGEAPRKGKGGLIVAGVLGGGLALLGLGYAIVKGRKR